MTYDFYSALDQGRRDYQEDAILGSFSDLSGAGFIVVSDGMGGHAAGHVASAIICDRVSETLRGALAQAGTAEPDICGTLQAAIFAANLAVQNSASAHPEQRGMGATVLATFVFNHRLYWISVGDSPLLLLRSGQLRRLNQDHSLGAQIDLLVQAGQMSADVAREHPDRHCLTSVLMGEDISQIDCPETPLQLVAGDVVIAASDGILFLENAEIEQCLCDTGAAAGDCSSQVIAQAIMAAIKLTDAPYQDNVALGILQIR